MRLYLDSARLEELLPLLDSGVFYGVTTNPLLWQAANLLPSEASRFAHKVIARGAQEVYFQSHGQTATQLLDRGRELAQIDGRVVVKLPATREGLEAASHLSSEGVRTCVTAVYTSYQVLLASAVRATYVAPYLGRLNDAGRDGYDLVAHMAQALRQIGSPTQVLAASIRSTADLFTLAQSGVKHITFSPSIAHRLFMDPMTLEATQAFESAAEELQA